MFGYKIKVKVQLRTHKQQIHVKTIEIVVEFCYWANSNCAAHALEFEHSLNNCFNLKGEKCADTGTLLAYENDHMWWNRWK